MTMKTSACSKCGEPMIWTRTRKGKNMPVDAEPSGDGSFYLIEPEQRGQENDGKIAAVWVPEDNRATRADLHTAHFATCPNADEFRK